MVGMIPDFGLLTGEAVTVKTVAVSGETDPFGAPIVSQESLTVENVLVAPGPTADLDAGRPEGVQVAFTLHFPKSFTGSLRGATVTVRGVDYAVIGDPQRFTPENTPGKWNLPAEVEATHG